jgi:hypothetical protein
MQTRVPLIFATVKGEALKPLSLDGREVGERVVIK